ncbi:MAG: hypothetical protein RMK57_13885 [Bryobacterales bacterium]|nr:hypothetical protein [Bryobacteraceae bacterium]MDW8355611.1 hypothetical protein [Bryobacterales bacterium]
MKHRWTWLGVVAVVAGVSLAPAQRGMGRGGGQPPAARGPVQRPAEAGRPGGAPRGADAPRGPEANRAVVHLQRHPELAARLAPLLPPGVTAEQAAAGFRNWGQFVAALHVSKNLGIPFEDVKARVTGPESLSLGKAIRELRPQLPPEQVRAAVREAEREAKRIRREAGK